MTGRDVEARPGGHFGYVSLTSRLIFKVVVCTVATRSMQCRHVFVGMFNDVDELDLFN